MGSDPSASFPQELLERNRTWVGLRLSEDPGHFRKLALEQRPSALVVACSDSRKVLDSMMGARAGELFIHRNVANQVGPGDPSVQAVLEFGILTLGIPHVIVIGHTRCGGVGAAMGGHTQGAVGSWLVPLRQLAARHDRELLAIPNHGDRADRLSEINVAAQVENVIGSPAYREALRRDAPPKLHGWVFDLATGYLREVWPRL